jgi:hypothetical protein
MKILATLIILSSLALAADAPKLNEVHTLKVQKTYLAAVVAKQNADAASKAFEAAKATFLATVEEAKKEEGLPSDADVRVDQDNNVSVTLPPVAKDLKK